MTPSFPRIGVSGHAGAIHTGISIKKFLQTLRPLQSAVINTGTQTITIPPAIPTDAQDILDALPGQGGH